MHLQFKHFSKLLLKLFCILAISLSYVVDAKSEVLIQDSFSQISLQDQVMVLEDTEGSWSFQDAQRQFDLITESIQDAPKFNFGITKSVYWAAFSIRSNSEIQTEAILEIGYPLLDHVTFYQQDASGSWVSSVVGDLQPFSLREFSMPNFATRIHLQEREQKTIFVRIETAGAMQFPMTLWSPQEFNQSTDKQFWGWGLFFGLMAAMILYNSFIYVSVREKSYLFYILYISNVSLSIFASLGLGSQFFWPENPSIGEYSPSTFGAFALIFGLLFCKSYLRVENYSKTLNKSLNIFVWLGILVMLLPFVTNYRNSVLIALPFNAITIIFILFTGFWVLYKGERAARFFVSAWLIFLLAALLQSMQRLGLVEGSFVLEQGFPIGVAIETILLSLGLADRINRLSHEKEKVQSELIEANQKTIQTLQQASAMKDEFIANVSHELRTPLTGIISLTDLVIRKNEDSLDAPSNKNLQIVMASGKRLASLVNDIIDVSAISRNQIILNQKAIDIETEINFVIAMCNPLIGNKDLELEVDVEKGIPLMLADENRLQQILFNLISNAIKFTDTGKVTACVRYENQSIKVAIIDTGIGIDKDSQVNIFKAFEQADGSIKRAYGGTGLGLSVTQKLLELHQSSIDLISAPGQGATFSFVLPVANEDVPKASTITQDINSTLQAELSETELPASKFASDNEEDSEQKHHVLVVDDEPVNLHILNEYLSPDYQVGLAQDGYQALEYLDQNQPDLLIVDLMMPKMSGYELCEKIREKHSQADLPILILTAKNQPNDLVQSLRSGANDYLSKPFHKEELLARLNKQAQIFDLIKIRDKNIRLEEQIIRFKQSEQRLYTSKNRLAKMLDVSSENLICVSSDGNIIQMNRGAGELLGMPETELVGRPIEVFVPAAEAASHVLSFPFEQSFVSDDKRPEYSRCLLNIPHTETNTITVHICILPLNLEQEFYVLLLTTEEPEAKAYKPTRIARERTLEMTALITEVNKNAVRVQKLGALLAQLTPEIIKEDQPLLDELDRIDAAIERISQSVDLDSQDIDFRNNLVSLMQSCITLWQKHSGRPLIELAEESKVWRVSIDNGRLRARSMERYLEVDKLPKNPRWREVTRTAYFILKSLSLEADEQKKLEDLLNTLESYE